MVEAIETFFLDIVGKELCVFFCAMLPIIECRGAVPLGWGFSLPWWQTGFLALAGNLIPIPFILLFIRWILRKMGESRFRAFRAFAGWLERKVEKHKGTIEKYSYLGVTLFVAIPIPGTGAWTGTLIASVLKLDFKKSLLAAVIGATIATTIMEIVFYGGISALTSLF